MKYQAASNAEIDLGGNLALVCERVGYLLVTFHDIGAQRELTNDELPLDVGERQIEIFNHLRVATAELSSIPAATSGEIEDVARIIRDLRKHFGFCGLDELTCLIQSYERENVRLSAIDAERLGMLGRGDDPTQH